MATKAWVQAAEKRLTMMAADADKHGINILRGPIHPQPRLPGSEPTGRLARLYPLPDLDDLDVPWRVMTPWAAWAAERESVWNEMDTGKGKSGKQSHRANYIGALGEALWHVLMKLKLRHALRVEGIQGADFSDGTDVKATGKWGNPWLAIPETQYDPPKHPLAPWFASVAVNLESIDKPLCALMWRITREQMFEKSRWWVAQDPSLRYPKKGGEPHFVVNWRSFPVAGISGPQGTPVALPVKPKPPDQGPTQEPLQIDGREAVKQMRSLLGKPK